MNNKVVSLKTYVQMKDLEELSQVLLNKSVDLQIENQKLKKRLEHLEELLKSAPVPDIKMVKDE